MYNAYNAMTLTDEAEPVNLMGGDEFHIGGYGGNIHHDPRWQVHEDRQHTDSSYVDFMPKGEPYFVLPINLNEEVEPVNLNEAEPTHLLGGDFHIGGRRGGIHNDPRWHVHEDRQWNEHGLMWGDG